MDASQNRTQRRTDRIASARPTRKTADNGLSVLLIEDSPTQAVRARVALEQEGFHVYVAAEAREAVEIARQLRPAAVVADIEMPRVDGYQLCTFFRSDPQLRNATFLLLGGEEPAEERERAAAVGASGYLGKSGGQAIGAVLRNLLAAESSPAA